MQLFHYKIYTNNPYLNHATIHTHAFIINYKKYKYISLQFYRKTLLNLVTFSHFYGHNLRKIVDISRHLEGN